MAFDSKEIKIILETRDGESGGGGSNAASGSSDRVDVKVSSEASNSSKGSQSVGKGAAVALGSMAARTVADEMVSWAVYEINKGFALEDNYIGQRQLSIASQAINWGISSASTIVGAAGAGAMVGGPWGAAIGATIGTIKVISSTIRGNVQAQEQQDIDIKRMNAQLKFTRNRAGWSTQAASIGEDL